MRAKNLLALGGLLGILLLVPGVAPPALSQRPPAEESLVQRLARTTSLPEAKAAQFFNALGPAIREDLTNGKQVIVPGLGTFRVVRIPEHRDLRDGRPVTIAAVNSVEFVPLDSLKEAANSDTAKPVDSVPRWQFNPFPEQQRAPGQKTEPPKVQPGRSRP